MLLSEAQKVYREDGLTQLLKSSFAYILSAPSRVYHRRVRPLFARTDRRIEYNRVVVEPFRTVDRVSPFALPANLGGHRDPPNYEIGLASALRRVVDKGDTVTVVGGGLGVTAVIAARAAGPEGRILVYEGGAEMVESIGTTLKINDVPCPVEVNHAIVGTDHELASRSGDADLVAPDELPPCDVLEMDCEGAEVEILSGLESGPEHVIVETHENRNRVREILSDRRYAILDETLAETGPYERMCREHDIRVLTAQRDR